MKQDEIKKQLNEWKVPYTDKDSYQELTKLYWAEKKKRDDKEGAGNSSQSSSDKSGGSQSATNKDDKQAKGVFYYLLKVQHYVAENERWDAGLYQCSKRIPRLDKSPIMNVEVFEGEIPDIRVYEIAKQYLVNTTDGDGKYLPADEVLEELVTVK